MRAIDADKLKEVLERNFGHTGGASVIAQLIDAQPTIQPEPHEIGYDDCSNALLKMWMDNVLTDGEYYRIADKLNEKWGKREVTK